MKLSPQTERKLPQALIILTIRFRSVPTAAVGAPDALNACGELVRPGVIQAEIVEAGIASLLVMRGSKNHSSNCQITQGVIYG